MALKNGYSSPCRMPQTLRPAALVPRGFIVEGATYDGARTRITVRHASPGSPCPGCGNHSSRVHSRNCRHLADLPLAGRPIELVVLARRASPNEHRFHAEATGYSHTRPPRRKVAGFATRPSPRRFPVPAEPRSRTHSLCDRGSAGGRGSPLSHARSSHRAPPGGPTYGAPRSVGPN